MKYFLIHISTRDGDHEYGEQLITQAKSMTAAIAGTKAELLATLANPDEDSWEDNELDLFDQILTIEHVREIPASDFAVLQQYLPVVNA